MERNNIIGELQKLILGVKIENPIVWDLQRLIFTIILVLLLIKPTSNAIFLSTVGVEKLPVAYLILALVALAISAWYNRLISRIVPIQLFRKTILVSLGILLLIGLLLFIPSIKIFASYVFYIFVSIFGIFLASQFWILANELFNAREARKYFGVIGFGAIAGGILGGYLASFIIVFLSSEWIPIIATAILSSTLVLIKSISLQLPDAKIIKNSSLSLSIKEPIKLIASSKHLTYIAIAIALSVFVSKIIDYQFGHFATRAFPSEEDLTQFYGVSLSTFNIIAILIHVFLTTRVVGKLGIGYSLLIMPIFLIINAGALLIIPSLISAFSIKLLDTGLKQSINKAAMELTMMPTPADIKLKTKTFLDVFVDSLATGVSGLVLIMVLQVFDLPNWIITSLILITIGLWLFITNKMRDEYKKVFRNSLNVKKSDTELGSTIIENYRNILANGNEFQTIKTLSILKVSPIAELEGDIALLILKNNSNIVKASLECLIYSKNDYSDQIIPLLEHPNQNINILAFDYIINHQKTLEPDFLLSKINHTNLNIQIIALAAYAKEFSNDPRTLDILRIEDRLENIIKLSRETLVSNPVLIEGILKTIGYGKFSNYYSILDKYLTSFNKSLMRNAILAAGETRSKQYFDLLCEKISGKGYDPIIHTALAKYDCDMLNTAINKARNAKDLKFLENISFVLELIPSKDSLYLLQSLFKEDDQQVRSQSIRALRVLSDKYPLLKIDTKLLNKMLVEETKYTAMILKALSERQNGEDKEKSEAGEMLTTILKRKIDDNLKTIFEILHILYPPENYLELYGYVLCDDDTLRNNAIEYVDNTLTNDIKTYIIPLLEYTVSFDFPSQLAELSLVETKKFLLENIDKEIRLAAKAYFNK